MSKMAFIDEQVQSSSSNVVLVNDEGSVVYQIQEEDTIFFDMLTRHKMDQYYMKLNSLKINIDCFSSIREGDIRDIFENEIGPRIKFRALVDEWRVLNLMEPIAQCCCGHSLESALRISASSTDSFKQSVSLETGSTPFSNEYKFKFDSFLNSDTGKKIHTKYVDNNILNSQERDVMVSNIVRQHLQKDKPMTTTIFDEISDDVVKAFANEKKEYFFQNKPRGVKLYNKYRSIAKTFRNAGLFTSRLRKPKSDAQSSSQMENTECLQQQEADSEEKEWLKCHNSPWKVIELHGE